LGFRLFLRETLELVMRDIIFPVASFALLALLMLGNSVYGAIIGQVFWPGLNHVFVTQAAHPLVFWGAVAYCAVGGCLLAAFSACLVSLWRNRDFQARDSRAGARPLPSPEAELDIGKIIMKTDAAQSRSCSVFWGLARNAYALHCALSQLSDTEHETYREALKEKYARSLQEFGACGGIIETGKDASGKEILVLSYPQESESRKVIPYEIGRTAYEFTEKLATVSLAFSFAVVAFFAGMFLSARFGFHEKLHVFLPAVAAAAIAAALAMAVFPGVYRRQNSDRRSLLTIISYAALINSAAFFLYMLP
jgi:hypothetical protein